MTGPVRVTCKEGTNADGTFFVRRISEVVPQTSGSTTAVTVLYQEHHNVPGGPSLDEVENMRSSR